VRAHHAPGKDWAGLASRIAANGYDDVDWRGVVLGELIPTLGPQAIYVVLLTLEQAKCGRMDGAYRLAASAECPNATLAEPIEQRFSQNAAR